jgi:hypothetical protein
MEDAQHWLGYRQIWLNRGARGLGHDAVMSCHEQSATRPMFLFKLKLTSGVRAALHRVPAEAWRGPKMLGAWQVAESRLALHGWKQERRVVFSRQLQGQVPSEKSGELWDKNKYVLAVYVTSLPLEFNAWILQYYCERADTEKVFDELKNQWGFTGFLRQVPRDYRAGGPAGPTRPAKRNSSLHPHRLGRAIAQRLPSPPRLD